MDCIYSIIRGKGDSKWRQVPKALQLLKYLISHGDDSVAADAQGHIGEITALHNFHRVNSKGMDEGSTVRTLVQEVVALLDDAARVRAERRTADKSRFKLGASAPALGSAFRDDDLRTASSSTLPQTSSPSYRYRSSPPTSSAEAYSTTKPPVSERPFSTSPKVPYGVAPPTARNPSLKQTSIDPIIRSMSTKYDRGSVQSTDEGYYVAEPAVSRQTSRELGSIPQSSSTNVRPRESLLDTEVESLRKELEEARASINKHMRDSLDQRKIYEAMIGRFKEENGNLKAQVKRGNKELDQFKDLNIFNLKGPEAVAMCDFVQLRLDQEPDVEAGALLLRFLQDLCGSSDQLPTSCWINDVNVHHSRIISRGGEAIILQGTYKEQPVAVRSILQPEDASWESNTGKETIKLIHREILTHRQLKHPNIIPLIGIFREDESQTAPLIVLPFYPLGSAKSWLKENKSSMHYLIIAKDIVQGLKYLHGRTPPVIHGDLHPGNILIMEGPCAVLCDFGFSRVKHDVSRLFSKIQITQNMRFLAPELLAPYAAENDDNITPADPSSSSIPINNNDPDRIRSTQQSDIYAFSMTLYDLGTLKSPFHNISSPYTVAEKVILGERPPRPDSVGGFTDQGTNDRLWSLMTRMWSQDPQSRPSLHEAESELALVKT